MFSNSIESVKMTLICGPIELTETFMFEGAMHSAKDGKRVIYVTPNRIDSLPVKYHDADELNGDILELVTFMYLPDSESLVERLLTRLDTIRASPSTLIIDKLESYTRNTGDSEDDGYSVAKTCAAVIDAMNASSRVIKKKVHVLASIESSSYETIGNYLSIYFNDIWRFFLDEESNDRCDGPLVILRNLNPIFNLPSFEFRTLDDRTIVMKRVMRLVD